MRFIVFLSIVFLLQNLERAVQNHDAAFVLSILHPYVRPHFGDACGVEDFKSFYRIYDSDTKLWDILSEVLSKKGGYISWREGLAYCTPYPFNYEYRACFLNIEGRWYLKALVEGD